MVNLQSPLSFNSSQYTLRTHPQSGSQSPQRSADTSQALSSMQDKALDSLASKIPGMDSSKLRKLDASEYTPDKIAGRISHVVAAGLANARASGKSEEEVQALYDSAVKGVEQGFKDAKEILSGLKLLSGGIADQVAETEQATFNALGEISPTRQSQPTSSVSAMSVAERYSKAEDFSLTLQTREGDKVKVTFSHNLAAQGSFSAAADSDGNQVAVFDLSRSESSGFQFSVDGDLNPDELEAIQNLVRDVGQVANEFFNGDVQKAFEQAPDISFDGSQLASMRLHMSRSEQYSAAQAYRQTDASSSADQGQSGLRLGHLSRQLSDAAQNPMLAFVDQAKEAISQIMQGMMEQDTRFKDAAQDQQASYQENMARLLNSVQSTGSE